MPATSLTIDQQAQAIVQATHKTKIPVHVLLCVYGQAAGGIGGLVKAGMVSG